MIGVKKKSPLYLHGVHPKKKYIYDDKRNFMAKLHFYYSAMNAGKTTTLLQSNYNYRERGMNTLPFISVYPTLFALLFSSFIHISLYAQIPMVISLL